MAYILLVNHSKGSEYLTIWSNMLEVELAFIERTNPQLRFYDYSIIEEDPAEEECWNLPQELNSDGKIKPCINYFLPTNHSFNYQWGIQRC